MSAADPAGGTMAGVISRNRQLVVSLAVVALAGAALGLGIAYQGERLPDDDSPAGDAPAGDTTTALPEGVGGVTSTTGPTDPIEVFLPRSGQASACREPVGVDLLPGYAATLTINGIEIAPEEMNVALDEGGVPTRELTASRSIGRYTYGPEEGCPNGRVLRPTDNVLQACVYRVEEGPDSCVIAESTFDVL
jgi:hypothetical protein